MAVGPVLAGRVDYTVKHFQAEEDHMARQGYPGLQDHQRLHAELLGRVEDFRRRHAAGRSDVVLDMVLFLRTWLVRHIQGADAEYAAYRPGQSTDAPALATTVV